MPCPEFHLGTTLPNFIKIRSSEVGNRQSYKYFRIYNISIDKELQLLVRFVVVSCVVVLNVKMCQKTAQEAVWGRLSERRETIRGARCEIGSLHNHRFALPYLLYMI